MSSFLKEAVQVGSFSSGDADIFGVVICDTQSDLPAQNHFTGYSLFMGSVAEVVEDGTKWKMNSSGTWKQQPADASVALDLSGYYTSAQVDAAINTAIMSTQYINRGTEIGADGADLDTLETAGKYFCSAYATACTNLPSDFSGLAFTLKVEHMTTTTGNRLRQILMPAAAPSNVPIPKIWIRYKTGSGTGTWRAWCSFTGVVL